MRKYAIITDFDGTVTTCDIGNALCLHFGTTTPEKIDAAHARRDDSRSWMIRHFGQVKTDKEEFEKIIFSYAVIKKGFNELASYAREHNIPFEIASGGLDIYINPILKKNNVAPIPVYSVQGKFTADGIMVNFPYYENMTLEHFKESRVKYYKAQGYTTIFLGDGPSDFEAAVAADIVFATSLLEKILREKNIPFHEFNDFETTLKIIRGDYVPVLA